MLVNFRSNRGFTLIEVILAVTILGVIAIPLFATFSTSFAIMAKRQEKIENVSIVRLAKENVVDSVKGGIAKSLKSTNDITGDSYADDNDLYYWNNTISRWIDSGGSELTEANNLKLFDSEGNEKLKYYFNVEYDEEYTDDNFNDNGYIDVKMFKVDVKKKIDNSLIKSINVVVNADS